MMIPSFSFFFPRIVTLRARLVLAVFSSLPCSQGVFALFLFPPPFKLGPSQPEERLNGSGASSRRRRCSAADCGPVDGAGSLRLDVKAAGGLVVVPVAAEDLHDAEHEDADGAEHGEDHGHGEDAVVGQVLHHVVREAVVAARGGDEAAADVRVQAEVACGGAGHGGVVEQVAVEARRVHRVGRVRNAQAACNKQGKKKPRVTEGDEKEGSQ